MEMGGGRGSPVALASPAKVEMIKRSKKKGEKKNNIEGAPRELIKREIPISSSEQS